MGILCADLITHSRSQSVSPDKLESNLGYFQVMPMALCWMSRFT